VEEYRTRMNRCIKVYNWAVSQNLCAASDRRMMELLIDRIRRITLVTDRNGEHS